jgi:hypothetical protein
MPDSPEKVSFMLGRMDTFMKQSEINQATIIAKIDVLTARVCVIERARVRERAIGMVIAVCIGASVTWVVGPAVRSWTVTTVEDAMDD